MSTAHPFVEIIGKPAFRNAIAPLSEKDATDTVAALGKRFVTRPSSQWWWEHIREDLPQYAYRSPGDDGYLLIPSVCPDTPVLFFVTGDRQPPWFGFSGRPLEISRAIAECPAFEYLVAATTGEWLLMENHHGVLLAVGEPVATELAKHDG